VSGTWFIDEATAMQKFQVWHNEHEAQLKKRMKIAETRSRRNPSVVSVLRGNDASVQRGNEA